MGNRPIRSKQEPVAFVPQGMDLQADNDGKVYMLKQINAGCSKCTFWRADPRTNALSSGVDYPRHGAVLRGTPIDHPKTGEPWLIVTHVAQMADERDGSTHLKERPCPFRARVIFYNK